MAVTVIDTIKPKNNGTFPVVEAPDVKVSNSKRLDAALNDKANQSDLTALSETVSGKASQADLTALSETVSGKQNALTTEQLAAANSGITSELVTQIGTNTTAIAGKASATDLATTNAAVANKADATDVATETASLQAQIDALVTPVTQDAEVENARVGADGTSYQTLKARLDAENNAINADLTRFTGNEVLECNWVMYKFIRTSNENVDPTTPETNTSYKYVIIPCSANDTFVINGTGGAAAAAYAFCDANNKILLKSTNQTITNELVIAPANTSYMLLNAEIHHDSTSYVNSFLRNTALQYGGKDVLLDLNDAQNNRFYWLAAIPNLLNAPTARTPASLLCYGFDSRYGVQIYIDRDNSMFTRFKNNNVFTNWTSLNVNYNNLLQYGGFNELTDFNNAEVNKWYWSAQDKSNMPENIQCSLMCYGYNNSYMTQICHTRTNNMYIRFKFNGEFSDWINISEVNKGLITFGGFNELSDFNNADVNKWYWSAPEKSNMPENCVCSLMCYGYNSSYLTQICHTETNNLYIRFKFNGVFTDWRSLYKEESFIGEDAYKIFQKVGCVGDSYTAGWIVNPGGGSYTDCPNYSWPHYMAKDSGNTYSNYGISGTDSKQWLSNNQGLAKAQQEKCQCYLIGLGINDSNRLTLGTIADCGTEADTFYRWYFEVITSLKAINADAPIFCMTMGNDRGSDTTDYNTAIRTIVSTYGSSMKLYLIDLYQYKSIIDRSYIGTDFISGHYTAIGYQAISKIIEKAFSDVITNHIADFQNVAFIDYE